MSRDLASPDAHRSPRSGGRFSRSLAANPVRVTPSRGTHVTSVVELAAVADPWGETAELRAVPPSAQTTEALPTVVPTPDPAEPGRAEPAEPGRAELAGGQARPGRPKPAEAAPDPSAPAEPDVVALVARAQAGDAEAFGSLYDRYFETIFRFIYFRVGSRPTAEDLTSDTFLRALRRIGSFTWQGRDLGAWLITIARNLVADHFKSGRYRLEVVTSDVLDADQVDRALEGSPELAVVNHLTKVDVLRAVQQLNSEQRECIVLRFLLGLSVAETARAMGKNEGAIKALQYRAVRTLHRLLPQANNRDGRE